MTSTSTVVDAFSLESLQNANNDTPCDVHLDDRYITPHASAVFLHAATSGHRWQHVLRTMLILLLTNRRVQHITVVAVGPQAAAACSLCSLTLESLLKSHAADNHLSQLLCKASGAPLYHREIPTLDLLHSQCQLPHLNKAVVTCVNLLHFGLLTFSLATDTCTQRVLPMHGLM